MGRQTNVSIVLNIISILCFAIWFWSIFVTLREQQNKTLLIAFCCFSLCLGLIPLVFLSSLLQSIHYAKFWGVPKDESPENTWDDDLVSDYRYDFVQVRRYVFAGIATFLYPWALFAIINTHNTTLGLLAILSLAVEGFCIGELFKFGPVPWLARHWAGGGAVDFGFFKYVIGNAVCTAQRLFGFNTKYMWIVFGICLVLIALHSAIPRCVYVVGQNNDDKQSIEVIDVVKNESVRDYHFNGIDLT